MSFILRIPSGNWEGDKTMSFKAIETQEDFDRAIKERLERERSSIEKQYADYEDLKKASERLKEFEGMNYEENVKKLESELSELKTKYADQDKTVSDLTKRAETAELSILKAKVAHEHNIPYELAGRLSGSTEEEMQKDAETFSKFVTDRTPAPLASTEAGAGSQLDSAYAQTYSSLVSPAG